MALAAAALLAAAYGGWRWGGRLFPRAGSWVGREAADASAAADGKAPGPELARRTVEEVDRFRRSSGPTEMALGQAEVGSVLRYSATGMLPDGVSPPDVELQGGHVHLSTRVDLASFPRLEDLDRMRALLPDTVPVEMDAALMPFGQRGAALVVYRVKAGGIPLPRSVIQRLLESMGRMDRPGLPPEAMLVPLPAGLRSAYILSDSLILVAAR